jgi:hypothetical protein
MNFVNIGVKSYSEHITEVKYVNLYLCSLRMKFQNKQWGQAGFSSSACVRKLAADEHITGVTVYNEQDGSSYYVSGLTFHTTQQTFSVCGQKTARVQEVRGHQLLYATGTWEEVVVDTTTMLHGITWVFDHGCKVTSSGM